MKNVTSATPNKKQTRQPTCKQCSKRFRTTSTTAIYCSRSCKERATTLKRQSSRIDRATHSAFMFWLAAECERAGTLQVLTGHTSESLIALYEVYKRALKANGFGDYKKFEISHISPVRGEGTLGLLHPDNLIVAPLKMNRSHGVRHYGHGKSILRAEVDYRYDIEKGSSRKGTIERIIKFIGADIVSEVVKRANIQPTQRYKLLAWLNDHLDRDNSEHKAHLDSLDTLSTKALSKLKATLLDSDAGFSIASFYLDEFTVLTSEWERLAHSCRPDLLPSLQRYQSLPDIPQTDSLLQTVFDMLHGRDDKALSVILDSFAPVTMEDTPASVQLAPVIVLSTQGSFLDELEPPCDWPAPKLTNFDYVEPTDPFSCPTLSEIYTATI